MEQAHGDTAQEQVEDSVIVVLKISMLHIRILEEDTEDIIQTDAQEED